MDNRKINILLIFFLIAGIIFIVYILFAEKPLTDDILPKSLDDKISLDDDRESAGYDFDITDNNPFSSAVSGVKFELPLINSINRQMSKPQITDKKIERSNLIADTPMVIKINENIQVNKINEKNTNNINLENNNIPFSLKRIVKSVSEYKAVIIDNTGKGQLVSKNNIIGGWTIIDIETNKIIIKNQEGIEKELTTNTQ